MSGERDPVHRSRRHDHRGTTRRAGRQPAEAARCVPGVIPALLELQRCGLPARAGQQPGRPRHAVVPGAVVPRTAGFPARPARLAGHHVRRGVLLPALPGRRLRVPQAADRAARRSSWPITRSIAQHSFVIGDRDTDMQLAANLGIEGLRVLASGADGATWPAIVERLCRLDRARRRCVRSTKETDIDVTVNLDRPAPIAISTGIGFFDHMLEQIAKHGGFSLHGRVPWRPRGRRAPHGRGLRAGARPGAA